MQVLSHEKLGITFQELGALLGFHAMLKYGVASWHSYDATTDYSDSDAAMMLTRQGQHLFNMGQICKFTAHCGSLGCIGGHMALLMGVHPRQYTDVDRSPILDKLFYPPHPVDFNYNEITAEDAVGVIECFLATGHVDWSPAVTRIVTARRAAAAVQSEPVES